MPPKRTRTEADVNWLFDLMLGAANVVKPCSDPIELITSLRSQVLSNLSSTQKEKTKAAGDFSMDEAIKEFGLKYQRLLKHHWDIEKEVEGKEFPTTPCIREPPLLKHMNETDPVITDRITTRQLLNQL
jgi:hypothetical protein